MLTIKEWDLLNQSEKQQCLERPEQIATKGSVVLDIIQQVQSRGDKALYEYTQKFDGAELKSLKVDAKLIQSATTNQETETALKQAIETISIYHASMLPKACEVVTAKGIKIRTVYRPIQRVGLYVPGGANTPLISSVLMQAIPAKIAACPIKILCTPPNRLGQINPDLLVAAKLCGIENIYAVGGAQAIAAMAYGTQTIPKVDKIFGPGNSYVTEAKTLVSRDPKGAAIDLPAGPSEVMVVADEQANPAFVAADLLAQAEHGVDSQVLLICESTVFAKKVNQELANQLNSLSRAAIIKQALTYSAIIVATSISDQIAIINNYAPEHLIINRTDAQEWVEYIYNAGSVFIGPWSAETLGDFVTGSNHVLPTNGFARSYSGLSTSDFVTRFSVQEISREGISNLGQAAITIAQLEGLDAHANAVKIRLEKTIGLDESNDLREEGILHLIPKVLRQGANYIPKETGDNFRLHANELPWCPVDFSSLDLNCYPDYETQNQVQKSLAEIYQVTPNQIVLTRGSDDGIDLLCRLFLNSKQDALMQFAPTFPMYAFYTRMQQAQLIQCPLDAENDFCLNQETVNNYWNSNCKIIMFCSPNNPTGTSIDLDLIAATCERYAGQSLIVVDEAYIEFSTQKSASSLIEQYENLVVLRTLSKAYGLAGLRLGSIIAQAKLIESCKKIIPPYSISSAVLALANNALARKDWFATTLNSIKEERKLLANTLKQFSFIKKIVPSEGNFLLLQIDKELTQELARYLAYRNIIVRDFLEDPTLCNYLRITVGDSQQNTLLIEALMQFLAGATGSRGQAAGCSDTKAAGCSFTKADGSNVTREIAGRCASISRQTKETAIELKLTLDSDQIGPINTPIAFFNHMLEQVAKHGGFNLQLQAQGDLEVDDHHLIEDTAIVLGQALKQALGDKRGINRYGFTLPMDEALATCALDLSGRGMCVFKGEFTREFVGGMATEMVPHFFNSLASSLSATLHISVTGSNHHHMIEACFKVLGRALAQACAITGASLPSTKGIL